ncbi:MAG: hypothetical protein U0414_31565 [Polyangiaceae bacterium]
MPSTALAAEEQELEAARTRIGAGAYEEAETRLRRMLDPKGELCPAALDLTKDGCRLADPENIQQARGYFAIALVANGNKEEAKGPIDDMLRHDPAFVPSLTLYPPDVVDLFIVERKRLADELAKIASDKAAAEAAQRAKEKARKEALDKYIASLEAQAAEETVTEKRSRLIAAIPFGVGQYQNGNAGLGAMFTIAETLGVGTMFGTLIAAQDLSRQAIEFQNRSLDADALDLPTLNQQIEILQGVNIGSLVVFGVFAIAGIAEAEASFKPSVTTTHDRKLPPKPKELEITGVPNAPTATGLGLALHF